MNEMVEHQHWCQPSQSSNLTKKTEQLGTFAGVSYTRVGRQPKYKGDILMVGHLRCCQPLQSRSDSQIGAQMVEAPTPVSTFTNKSEMTIQE